jgi:hypothetical protein
MLTLLVLSVPTALAEDWPPGAIIEDAAAVDIPPAGFEAIAELIPALLPTAIEIPSTGTSGDILGFCDYGFALDYGAVNLEVQSAHIVPVDGYLDITAELMVGINDASNPFSLFYEYCFGSDNCGGYVDAFPVTIHTTMNLEVIDDGSGQPTLDATIGALEYEYGLDGGAIHLDCWIQDIEDFLGYLGLSVYDLILGALAPTLESTIAEFGPTLEETIEDAFSSAVIQQELELNGAVATINLFPSDVDITSDGVRLVMSGGMDAEPASCIAAYDPGGSPKTSASLPPISSVPLGVHAALSLSDDFTNAALYALWRGGLLCVSTESLDLPIALDTALMGSLTGNVFDDLFPESKPVSLRTVPRSPLSADFAGPNDVDVLLKDLDLEFYAELDGRTARIVDISITGNVGANLNFDSVTGNLGIELALDAEALTPVVVYNELKPEQNAEVETAFQSSFGVLVESLIGSLLGDALAFALPSFSGLGLTSLTIDGDNEWLLGYAQLGPVAYGSSEEGGCGSCGDCSGGSSCTIGGTSIPAAWAGLPVLGMLILRRRRA